MTRFCSLVFALFVICCLPLAALAERAQTGSEIPHTLQALDHTGQSRSFENLKGEKGAVLVFVRSVDWCPYCQTQLIDLGERGNEIEELGYALVIISYDDIDKQAAFVQKYDFKYTLLSDTGSQIIKAFGILNEDMEEGSLYYGVPHPGIYVVSSAGVIQAQLFEEGYKQRPPVDDITQAITSIGRF